ncbi:sugar O-acetyltransferase [Lactococcus lactis]|uniref:Sugar O-acetyltransferase n=2 Tax=Lactococcus lactis TaxID=1358 RepID=A0AAW7IVW7_9LACT|nr:sugar O-acetyltransferase [Lactococcus lactis]KST89284.1 Maltose O-acetyltransferase [Lactococcus lactis subsp. lactis]MCT0060760.1 sugar O-acetyltransferase [Lactococcus lactis subsp. lactis]MCT0076407.1 sugar O-acetyltransferase [Lactococcus lactis subsp. lactis]MCT0136969.1 sugar O-acetyltransferase [Lactococcus lactis subsp. lactis]MCT3119504.1 sugar O-acetyltransferase [Lactococcus lactis]
MAVDFDYQEMLLGNLYLAGNILPENKSIHGKKIIQKINNTPIEEKETIVALERQVFGETGDNLYVTPPFQVDYGRHVEIGNNFYANMDCIFLDINKIKIGNNVMVGPRVSFYTAGHPIDPQIRIEELEFGLPITVEDNVWIGGSATILPGVTIGKNSIIAAGAVVTKDVAANTIFGGNPAQLIRAINEEDNHYWNKKKEEYQSRLKEK